MIGGGAPTGALPLAERLYVTEIDAEIDGDVFFPELEPGEWRCVEQSERSPRTSTFSFRVYERERPCAPAV